MASKMGPVIRDIREAVIKAANRMDADFPDLPMRHSRQLAKMRRMIADRDRFDGGPNSSRPDGPSHRPGDTPAGTKPYDGPNRNREKGPSAPSDGASPVDRSRNPDWLNDRLDRDDLPFWRRRMAEGDQFNYQNYHRYAEAEVKTADGKFLDSYSPPHEIVSRKNTQLSNVKPETAMRYLDEIAQKYWPGTRTADGRRLEGDPYLEVPLQDGAVPQSVIDHANSFNPPIIIRDPSGREYN